MHLIIKAGCSFFLIFLTSCSSTLKQIKLPNDQTEYRVDQERYFISKCSIFNEKFVNVRNLSNSRVCTLTNDGGWIEIQADGLSHYSKNGSKIWFIPGLFHHQIKIYKNKFVYSLYSIVKMINNKKVYFDGVYQVDLKSGKIISSFSGFEEFYINKTRNLEYFDLRNLSKEGFLKFAVIEADLLNTHLNSISIENEEILINDYGYLAFKLSLDLKFKSFDHAYYNSFKADNTITQNSFSIKHDYQILPNQNYLVFRNFKLINEEITYKIYEFNNNKIHFEFPTEKKDFQLVPRAGSVEKIDDNSYLVGFPLQKQKMSFVGIVSTEGKWIKKGMLPFIIQDIKIIPNDILVKIKDSFFEKDEK